ncbi:hypothetical protein [Paenibacillus polymyxa]|uniref:hypothetical protein n=1 Tax=Paenibacillus polymyxa TaxID=1406 RepID=UPI00046D0A41|nr:hypothetical protein [Paenibacillus polymyxa]
MPNANGWLSRDEVRQLNVPVLIPDKDAQRGKWHNGLPPAGGVLLTRTSCAAMNCPVTESETPVAYMYNPKHRSEYRYAPFYFRTSGQIHPGSERDAADGV